MKRYFVWDRDNNEVILWDTAEEAKEDAEKTLGYCRDDEFGDGWPEHEETCIIWGKIMEAPRQVNHETKKQYEARGEEWPYDGDEVYDLQLAPVPDREEDAEIIRLKEQLAEYKRKVREALDGVETCLDGWPGQSVVRYADVVAALKSLEN